MKSASIQVISGATDTLPVDTDPNYQGAVLSLMIRKTLENIQTNGIGFKLTEVSDLVSIDSDFNTFLANANTRFDEWLQGQFATVFANLPDVISVGEAMLSGGGSAVGSLILNRVLGMLFHQEDSRAEHEGAHANLDTSEIEAQLEAINAKLQDATPKSIAQIESELLGAISGAVSNVQSSIVNDLVTAIHTILNEYTINIVTNDIEHRFTGGRPS